jgi:hypothetical protein
MKYDFNKCTKEQLVAFARTALTGGFSPCYREVKEEIIKTAEVKLRTRSEVDADIAKVIREYHGGLAICAFQGPLWSIAAGELDKLCKEETQG